MIESPGLLDLIQSALHHLVFWLFMLVVTISLITKWKRRLRRLLRWLRGGGQ